MKKKLKIGLICEAGFYTGTYNYSTNLAESLNKIGYDATLITPFYIEGLKSKQLVVKSQIFHFPIAGRALWLFSLYFRLCNKDFDIIQSSWYGMIDFLPWDIYKNKLKVTTIFDVMGDVKEFRIGARYLFIIVKIFQPPHIKFNDVIITSSERSKDQLIKVKHVPKDKLGVTYYGVTDEFERVKSKETLKDVKRRLILPDNFILNVGGIKMTKNILRIVQAFSLIAKKNTGIYLVLSGRLNKKFNADEYHKQISSFINGLDKDISSRIIFLDRIQDKDLPAVYSLSRVFLMPSLEEGFGLPLLEAMRAGCACVTSKISCMPEVAGDTALLCNPYNITDIQLKVEKLLDNKTLRQKLSKKAVSRAKKFTWEKTARNTIKIYNEQWRKKFHKND